MELDEKDLLTGDFLVTAVLAAVETGKAIMEVYRGKIDVEYKDDKSPLTLADKRSQGIIFLLDRIPEESPLNWMLILSTAL